MDAKEPQSPIQITGETEAWRVVTQFQALYPKMRIILRRLDKKILARDFSSFTAYAKLMCETNTKTVYNRSAQIVIRKRP